MNPANYFGVIGPGLLNQVPTLALNPNPSAIDPEPVSKPKKAPRTLDTAPTQ